MSASTSTSTSALPTLRQALCQLSSPTLFAKLFANFPAQCAPLDLNLGPAQLSVHRWTSTGDLPSGLKSAKCRGWIPVIVPVPLLTVSREGLSPRPLLVKEGGGGVVNWEVSRDWRFHPPNTLLKQEGLQLAEASFRDKNRITPCVYY